MVEVNYEELAHKWWVQAATPTLTRKPKNKKIIDAIYTAAELEGQSVENLDKLLKQMSPRKSKRDAECVAYYDNSYKYENDRLTYVAAGRFLKKVLPNASDKMVEAFTMFWQNNIAFSQDDYILSIGTTREDFKTAFTNYYNARGFTIGGYNKAISDSCMRYGFDGLGVHPAEAYASGDFEVVVVKSKTGRTRARSVVRIKDLDGNNLYDWIYIYAADNHSAQMIRNHFTSMDGKRNEDWHGAKLLNLKSLNLSSDYKICPYVDFNRYVLSYDKNYNILVGYDYLNRMGLTEILNNTSGYVWLPDDHMSSKYRKPEDTLVKKPVFL